MWQGEEVTGLALWATPRTVSTAFERMMIERGDHVVLDEPWSRAYYFGPERRSGRYPLTFPESTYSNVRAGVLAAGRSQRLFVKDMAYHAAPELTDDDLAAMTHTFLIREPRAALTSLHAEWPDFTDDETGYAAQRELFDRVIEVTGSVPAVIDSDVLRSDPARIISLWCHRVGIEYRPASLHWEPGMRAEWQLWRDWYTNAAASTGFAPPTPPADRADDLPERVEALLPRADRELEPLRQHILR